MVGGSLARWGSTTASNVTYKIAHNADLTEKTATRPEKKEMLRLGGDNSLSPSTPLQPLQLRQHTQKYSSKTWKRYNFINGI
jgi:hypothetical protein